MEQKGSVELSLLSREAAELSVFSSAPIRATPGVYQGFRLPW